MNFILENKMKTHIGKYLKNTVYAVPFIVASVMLGKEASGQNIVPPIGDIVPFKSQDTTEPAKTYNILELWKQRTDTIDARVKRDWTSTIRGQVPPWDKYLWNCNQWSQQIIVNSHNSGKNIYGDDNLFLDGYSGGYTGPYLDSLYIHGGSFSDEGILGLPTFIAELSDSTVFGPNGGHAMIAVLVGDSATVFTHWYFFEPSNDQMGIQFGDGRSPAPLNCKHVKIMFPYIFKNDKHEKNYMTWTVLEFEVINGEGRLTYNINQDTSPSYGYLDFKPWNEIIHLQETRIKTGIHDLVNRVLHQDPYPNPATDYINVGIPQNMLPTNTEIYSIDGKTLIKSQDNRINVQNLKSGNYIIRSTNNKKIYTGKFIKKQF
jgi:Secretion system C-terminal sorting domain